ncbi:unnamed protein product [Cyclocybe aegerita]|uniref:Rab-GAP TBC domain-containing protein n=1 Tax=Cyclocybe aegerita TaxID=1973307 RepID=A0A8S0XUC5_CYCAE|nr:unnamed protein product [Cyclocybe aegerita]
MNWDPSAVKSQIRLTSQRLGQLQAKNDSQANITRTDIATLIQRNNVPLAREKAEKLIQDEAFGDLLDEVEMLLGILLEHFHELESGVAPSPVVVEAASTIIFVSPHVHSKDLDMVRTHLAQNLGPDFTRSAMGNLDQHVSRRVLKALSTPIPSVFQLDGFLYNIANSYRVAWTPEPRRQDIVNTLSELLDPEAAPEVDLALLRRLCVRGIPDQPVWLRPRVWKLFFAILPKSKAKWRVEITKQRDAYYELVKRLLEPFSSSAPSPTLDDKLLNVYKDLSGLPRDIFSLLEEEPETFSTCPLSPDAPEEIRIPHAQALELRLTVLQERDRESRQPSPTPEIRLEPDVNETPAISLTSFDSGLTDSSPLPKTLLPSRKCIFGSAHTKHCAILLRLLYLHNIINPGNLSLHTASLLVPLYTTCIQEIETDELAHVEADTFWLLEAVVAELSGLEDDGGSVWMKKFSQRLAWADYDLFTDLQTKGLDPGVPHFSYRWLMPLLAHTIPLPSLVLVWDALFSCQSRDRDTNPRLEYLLDICTSMLVRAKNHMSRVNQGSRSLWTGEVEVTSPTGNTQETFIETLSFLQSYDLRYVGGIERILQTAAELAHRREQESAAVQQPSLTLGARLKANVWKGFAYQQPPAESSNVSSKPANGHPASPASGLHSGFAAQLTNTVWRGITNQSAMDDTPSTSRSTTPLSSPLPELSTLPPPPSKDDQTPPAHTSTGVWGYAGKLKDSDAVATISKVSTNLRARGLLGSWSAASSPAPSPAILPEYGDKSLPSLPDSGRRRGSVPFMESPTLLSPPPPLPDKLHSHPQSSPDSAGILDKTKALLSKTRSPPPSTPRSAPRPLLLNSATSIVSGGRKSSGHHPSGSLLSTPDTDEWAHVMREKRHNFHRDSQSSISSLSPADAFARVPKSARLDWESDSAPASRVVALNRRSVSPMAPNFRFHSRPPSRASSVSSDIHSPPPLPLAKSPLKETDSVNNHVDPSTAVSKTKPTQRPPATNTIHVPLANDSDASDTTSNEVPRTSRKPSFTVASPAQDVEDNSQTVTTNPPARTARVRSKRYRPANLQIQDHQRPHVLPDQRSPSPSTLAVPWPGDDQDMVPTPKAANFDSDGQNSLPGLSRSPRRSRKISLGDRQRKGSADTFTEERPRKISSGHRARKVSSESREVPRSRRESAADEGDDEGYDDLLSAYESEDAPNGFSMRK